MNNKKEDPKDKYKEKLDPKDKYKEKLDPKVKVLFNVANTHLQFLEDYVQKQRESFYTLLGAQIFYLNKCKEFNYSGQISQKAKDAREKSNPITREHFHPRMKSGKELVDYLKKNKGNKIEDAMDWIKEQHINKWGQYHLTTKVENRKLRMEYKKPVNKPSNWSKEKYDNWKKAKTWRKAYKRANIDLIIDTK